MNIYSFHTRFWFSGLFFLLSLILFSPQSAFAQSPSFSHTATQTLNAELTSENQDTVNDVVNNAIKGARGFQPNPGTFSNSRTSRTKHDGYTAFNEDSAGTFNSPKSETNAVSFYASAQADLSRSFGLPANEILRVGVMGSYSRLFLTVGPDAFVVTPPGITDSGKGDNKSYLVGLYGLYAIGTTYVSASVSGNWGESTVTSFNATGFAAGNYDTRGFSLSASAGHIFDLGNDIKIDGRTKLDYAMNRGDSFTDARGDISGVSRMSSLAGTLSMTLYKNIAYDGMVIQPFTKMGLKLRFHNENTVELHTVVGALANGPATGGDVTFDDSDLFWHSETGVVIASGKYRFNASGYYEGSADSSSIGGKIGVKYQF